MGLSNYIWSSDIDDLDKEIEGECKMFDAKKYLHVTEQEPDHVSNCIEAQSKLCKDKKFPHFAPHDGKCYRCGKQIYDKITLERASSDLITGCPQCGRSYCD